MDINNFGNFKLIKCIHLLLDKEGIFKNTSNYLILIILIISIISIFIFSLRDYLYIKKTINKFFFTKKLEKNDKITKNNRKRSKTNSINKKNNNIGTRINLMNTILNQDKNNNQTGILNLNRKGQKKYKKNNRNLINNNNINNLNKKNKIKKSRQKSFSVLNTLNNYNKNKEKEEEEKNTYTDYEMNTLEYKVALKIDKRTYIQYYLSLFKTNHLLFFTFFNNDDYNSKIIKIYIFFLNIVTSYTLNAMFYGETIMHKIYIESGKFNFFNQIPPMIYSSLIGSFLNAIIKSLGLYQNNIIKIKIFKKEDIKNIENKKESELNKIKLKVLFFYIISYVFILFFWIYLGCFCAVYKNTQIHLLQEVSSSFAISFITPIFVCLLPGLFRIPSLKNKEKNKKYIYNVSKIIQIF